MPISQQRAAPVDVTKTNPIGKLYGQGDDITDLSHRFIFDSLNETLNLEKRNNGVWNLGALMVGGETIFFGFNLNGTAEGRFWVIDDAASDTRTFMAGFEVNDAGSLPGRIAKFGVRNTFLIIQSDDSVDTVYTNSNQIIAAGSNILTYNFILRTGSTAATADLLLTVRIDSAAGPIIHQQTFAANQFPANTQITLPFIPPLDFREDQPFFNELKSDQSFSLLGTVAEEPWFAIDVQTYDFEDLISTPTGTDRFLIGDFGNVVSDNSGNLILDGELVTI